MPHHSLYSIGHGTRHIDDFIHLVKQHKIQYIADVRSTPYSRHNPQYNRPPLVLALEKYGIRYVYMGDQLGGRPTDPAVYDEAGKLDFHRIHHQSYFQKGISRIIEAHGRGLSIALLCSESRPEQCHRTRIIGRELAEHRLFVQHIDENGTCKDQRLVLPVTMSLFAPLPAISPRDAN